ncbi:MAG: class I SAM-dependent methyltransferase [Opitutaceae bacterium]
MANSRLEKEREFHDRWAAETETESIRIREAFEAPTALENQFILSRLGDLRGRRILDIGAGLCESSVYFALQGAHVTATDLSPEMLLKGQELARNFGTSIEAIAADAEQFDSLPGNWEIIYCANTLHHLHQRKEFLKTCHQLLAPGGIFVTWDLVAYNPVINVYRHLAMDVRTADEAPLTTEDLALIKETFHSVETRFFWLLTLVLFLKYFLIDRLNPGKTRYWKEIYRESPETLWWWMPLRRIDRVFTQIPLIRWLAWNLVTVARKAP